jgi:hypothetical protein
VIRRVSDSSTIFEHFTNALHKDDLENDIENKEKMIKLSHWENKNKKINSSNVMKNNARQDKTRQHNTTQHKTMVCLCNVILYKRHKHTYLISFFATSSSLVKEQSFPPYPLLHVHVPLHCTSNIVHDSRLLPAASTYLHAPLPEHIMPI